MNIVFQKLFLIYITVFLKSECHCQLAYNRKSLSCWILGLQISVHCSRWQTLSTVDLYFARRKYSCLWQWTIDHHCTVTALCLGVKISYKIQVTGHLLPLSSLSAGYVEEAVAVPVVRLKKTFTPVLYHSHLPITLYIFVWLFFRTWEKYLRVIFQNSNRATCFSADFSDQ